MSASAAPLSIQRGRRERLAEDPDQEGWMVSYADLITLLFIFFALMLSISVVSKAKFELLTQQFNRASATSLLELQKQLNQEIQSAGLQGRVGTRLTDEGLQVVFSEGILFGSADAKVSASGAEVMAHFAKVLGGMNHDFRVAIEGHTDDRPIHSAEFPNNWALSAVRSVNVLGLLAQNGIDEKKMVVHAYAATRPVSQESAPSDGDRYRAQNRRVTLLIF